jgi:hypothetical protein
MFVMKKAEVRLRAVSEKSQAVDGRGGPLQKNEGFGARLTEIIEGIWLWLARLKPSLPVREGGRVFSQR